MAVRRGKPAHQIHAPRPAGFKGSTHKIKRMDGCLICRINATILIACPP